MTILVLKLYENTFYLNHLRHSEKMRKNSLYSMYVSFLHIRSDLEENFFGTFRKPSKRNQNCVIFQVLSQQCNMYTAPQNSGTGGTKQNAAQSESTSTIYWATIIQHTYHSANMSFGIPTLFCFSLVFTNTTSFTLSHTSADVLTVAAVLVCHE